MKKIFIMAHSMDLGGAEMSLLGILENIDYSKFSVDLFLLRKEGQLLKYVPKNVNILPEKMKYSALGIPVKEALKKKQFSTVAMRLYGKLRAEKRNEKLGYFEESNIINEYSHKYTVKAMPMISNTKYDVAISFVSPHYFVSEKIKAAKKIAWIHTDYTTLKVDIESELKMWKKYDSIVSISKDVTNSFLQTFPSLKEKIVEIENIIPIGYIRKLSNQFMVDDEIPKYDGTNILSIGRFVYQKRFDDIPKICKKMCELGENVRWYIIGFGMEEDKIYKQIKECEMEKNVIILGKKDNPYPYIKACDLYAQPSRYEGKSIAVREAQILQKPVVITNYSTAASQLKNGYDGLIVPMDIEGCAREMCNLIQNKSLMNQLITNTKKENYVHKEEILKLEYLLEN